MEIHVKKQSDVSVREQLVAQIAFLIATRKLKPGDALPSVRALARQLKIHHNTISEAYQALVEVNFLVRRRGSRMIVQGFEKPVPPARQDLDDLINETVRIARERGYSMQQLTERLRACVMEQPPDRILALSPDLARRPPAELWDSGMRRLMEAELKEAFRFPVRSCSPDELLANPTLAAGALVVGPRGFLPSVLPVLPKFRAAIPIVYSPATEHMEMVRRLLRPSLITVMSISEVFLEIARGLLSPVTGRQHSLVGYLVADTRAPAADSADILFCDVIARDFLSGAARSKAVLYRLISPECLRQIASAMAA